MLIDTLWIENFRNYRQEKVFFGPSFNLIIGENAQGKTNLLEAVLYLSSGRSHRANREEELINDKESFFYLKGLFSALHGETLLEVFRSREEKRLKINLVEEKRLANFLGLINTVIFSPEDLRLIKDSPAERRRFLNILISQLYPKYYSYLQDYRKIIFQRNSLLKRVQKGIGSIEELETWDEQLAETGAKIVEMRIKTVEKLAAWGSFFHEQLTEGKEKFSLSYKSSIPFRQEIRIKDSFLNLLQEFRKQEILRGISLIGPHRDDMVIFLDEKHTRIYGSQGQQRTAALTVKLAEIELIKEIRGDYPILLLDDVMSELDPHRQAYLLETIGEKIQTLITSTDLKPFSPPVVGKAKIFTVSAGNVVENQ